MHLPSIHLLKVIFRCLLVKCSNETNWSPKWSKRQYRKYHLIDGNNQTNIRCEVWGVWREQTRVESSLRKYPHVDSRRLRRCVVLLQVEIVVQFISNFSSCRTWSNRNRLSLFRIDFLSTQWNIWLVFYRKIRKWFRGVESFASIICYECHVHFAAVIIHVAITQSQFSANDFIVARLRRYDVAKASIYHVLFVAMLINSNASTE